MVKAVVFDAYGTLYDVHSVARRCEALFPGRGAQLSSAWRARQLEYTWLRSLMQRYAPFSQVTRESLAWACSSLGLALDAGKEAELMGEYARLAPFPDAASALARLAGRPRAILSNGSPDMLEPLVRDSGLPVDLVLSVDALQVFKPAPQVYALACERLGARPGDVAFVSSNGWDAIGAKAFGLRSCWVNRGGAPLDRLGETPDAVLASLAELPGLLQ